MHLITRKEIEQVWKEMVGYDEQKAKELDERVSNSQPHVLPFALAVLDEFPEATQEWAVNLSYFVTEVFMRASDNKLSPVSFEEFLDSYESVGEQLFQLAEEAQDEGVSISPDKLTAQPHLLTAVVEILDAGESEGAISDSDVSALLCLMLAIINAYNNAWARLSM